MTAKIFELEIARDGSNGYRSRVLTSPAGEASEPFVPPFRPDELADLRCAWEASVSGGTARNLGIDEDSSDGFAAEEIGSRLFHASFTGKVRSLFDESRGKAEDGLRLLLRFNLENKDIAWVSSLPWELLFHPDLRQFIALDSSIPIVRWLEVPMAARRIPLQKTLRILLAAPSPANQRQLNLEGEWERLAEEIGRDSAIELRLLRRPTFDQFRDVLRREGPFQVVHFMGHGEFDQSTGLGCLVFETRDGNAEPVSADVLGDVFCQRGREPLLFVLNACESARIDPTLGLDPFAGVAAKLVQRGAPAVVAMQLPILDEAAIAFSESLYGSLARAEPVDVAVAHGRLAIRCVRRKSVEWATPVLFLRTRDGRLFETPRISEIEPSSVQAPPVSQMTRGAGASLFNFENATFQGPVYQGRTLNWDKCDK